LSGITLDAGGLIAIDRDNRDVLALVSRATQRGFRITVPATALAQAIRNPSRQARLSRLIRDPRTDVIPLDATDATAVGLLIARGATSDIVDAHVVICARRAKQPIITSEAGDLQRIDPTLRLIPA
jgi:hypothetical protein